MRLPSQHVECFHLVLLRMLESRLDRSSWVVKGGVNLKAWFGSLRYLEDLDLDVVKGSSHWLKERVDRVLAAKAFHDMLATQGLKLARSSKPKQTETTQRWKLELRAEVMELPLHTRIEFSRGGSVEEHALEPVQPEIVRPYGLVAPTVRHYTVGLAELCHRSEESQSEETAKARFPILRPGFFIETKINREISSVFLSNCVRTQSPRRGV